jgi:hypothetical protein
MPVAAREEANAGEGLRPGTAREVGGAGEGLEVGRGMLLVAVI